MSHSHDHADLGPSNTRADAAIARIGGRLLPAAILLLAAAAGLAWKGGNANATAKLDKMEASRGPVGDAVRAGRVGVRMLQATLEGRYDKVPVKSLAAIAGAMLYFVQGDDLIDDDTPFIGYLDDAAVIAMALKVVQGDLDAFLAWEQGAAAASQA